MHLQTLYSDRVHEKTSYDTSLLERRIDWKWNGKEEIKRTNKSLIA